jgi:leucyl aminopeptidase
MLKHFNLQIVDLATLTGACIIALGNEIGGQSHSFKDLH